ncbi:VMAP-C domain-containing protein [Mastigocoleus testarum]|uniref:Uncharacterized protein n=1 Tax=Mastigocoleus testarum BC008 TaxID=371196 RepID=A0A0V7ZK94_9CYAN|nr:effector-associated domain EAD1-containing protein [Mastigocoleus testarum]KST64957.1 hypothetical protein BC008_19310 [Mastigocoleus testarum BC008]KST64994.1 hypothetical protein BC008_19495 [Mastigocoleus testarum BC008]
MSNDGTKLSGQEIGRLRDAIISAFPDKPSLEMMVAIELDENLDEIAGGNNFKAIVFNLIKKWAEPKGKLKNLVEGACKENPGNHDLKSIRRELFPKLSDSINLKNKFSTISRQQWKDLCLIIAYIDLALLKNICRITLENNSKFQDILGNLPELIKPENLGIFKTIFLDKYPKNNRDIPTIIEFVERLTKEQEISTNIREQLNCWLNLIAKEFDISLPCYEVQKLSQGTRINSYLLVTVTPNSSDKFYLQAELIPNYLPKETNSTSIKIEKNSNLPNIECSLSDIVDNIYNLIRIAKTQYLHKHRFYNLVIEVFLPLQLLDANLDLKDIPIGLKDKTRPFGSEYKFLVRSLDRFISHDGEYFHRLYSRWEKLNYWMKNCLSERDIENNIHHISQVDDCNWEEIETELEIEEKLGVKITCCLPESKFDREDLFITILRGGVPIFLWTRRGLPDIEYEINKLLDINFFKDEFTWTELVWKLRKRAHAKRDKENYLGYNLGFLCDNPHRVPFNLTIQNQYLIETGM